MAQLSDTRVLVTGGTRGIGLAIALRLVRDGASRVVLGYMLDGIPAKLIDIRVVFAISNRVLWSYPIDGSASGTLPLPFDRTPPSEDGFQFRMLGEEDEGDQAVDGDEGG